MIQGSSESEKIPHCLYAIMELHTSVGRFSKMAKRCRADEDRNDIESHTKRVRLDQPDRLSNLSDELVLRILSYLTLADRVVSFRCACPCYD